MWFQRMTKTVGLVCCILIGVTGCGVWPVMKEANGRRPHAMGKSDQVFLPGAPHPVHLSEEFGIAYRQAVEHQILNPRSSNNMDSVPGGADPRAIQYSLARYQAMFENPPFSTLKLGGGSSKGGSGKKTGSGGGSKK